MRVKTAGLTALVTVPALLLATACTSDDGKQPAKGTSSPAGTQTGRSPDTAKGGAEASEPLSGPQLERAALATGDLPGFQCPRGRARSRPPDSPPPTGTSASRSPTRWATGRARRRGTPSTVGSDHCRASASRCPPRSVRTARRRQES